MASGKTPFDYPYIYPPPIGLSMDELQATFDLNLKTFDEPIQYGDPTELSLMDQPMSRLGIVDNLRNLSGYDFEPHRIPEPLKHIDRQVWDKYENQLCCYKGFDIDDFPGVCYLTPIVPMNLQTNPDAIARAKDVADFAINWYNTQNETDFSVVSVDKANCNLDQCAYVDPEKYVICFSPRRECCCKHPVAGSCRSCMFILVDDRFYITFTAKEDKTCVTKVFQAQVLTMRETHQNVVKTCEEKSAIPPESDWRAIRKRSIMLKMMETDWAGSYLHNEPNLPPEILNASGINITPNESRWSGLNLSLDAEMWSDLLPKESVLPPMSLGFAESDCNGFF